MLYICPTPIGNLEDITLRVLRVLGEVDLILAEDTRHTGRLLHHFGIKKPLKSFYEHNEKEKTAAVINLLKDGQNIALVSSAGMPGISDPGAWLIQNAIKHELPIEVLPGANAALVGYLQSGFLSPHFLFYGFLPRREQARQQALENLKTFSFPIIFYEAPHRLSVMLQDMSGIFGDRLVSVSRELTKSFEETRRGRLSEIIEFYRRQKPRGEFVVTVEGAAEPEKDLKEDDIIIELTRLMDSGLSRKTAVDRVSREYRLPKNRVYAIALEIKPEG